MSTPFNTNMHIFSKMKTDWNILNIERYQYLCMYICNMHVMRVFYYCFGIHKYANPTNVCASQQALTYM